MPQKSPRAKLLSELYHMRKRILIEGPSDSDEVDEAMKENLELQATIESCRYLSRPSTYRNNGENADLAFQEWITDRRIVVFTHMSRRSLDYFFFLIKDSSLFVNPSPFSPSQQRSVYFQLFVCLTNLTGDGDGGCIDRIAELFNIGHGTITNYTERFIAAINEHADEFVVWPDSVQRAALSTIGEQRYGFPGFIASCDGTLIGLRRAPVFAEYPEAYCHPRHKHYGFNCLFWVDHHGTIMRFTCNWPASASDQTIFDASDFAKNPWRYLKEQEEYIFVDLGFKKETFAVPPYKGKEGKLQWNKKFNKAQRMGRVKVEHANGVIKARFGSLNNIPIDIRSAKDYDRCAEWIRACVVLHNALIQLRDEFDYELPEAPDADEEPFLLHENVSAKMFVNAVRDRWLVANGWEVAV
jgi:hypothetical protein